MNNEIIFLSFNGDKERNYNLPEVLCYPDFVSYSRSFSYKSDWVSPNLRTKINHDPQYCNNKEGLLCMKLNEGNVIIPIRKIKILSFELHERTYIFNFRMDKLVSFMNKELITGYSELFENNTYLAEICEETVLNNISTEGHENLWIDIVEKLSNSDLSSLEYCKITLFYKIMEIKEHRSFFSRYLTKKSRGEKTILISPKKIEKRKDFTFQFKPGKLYTIRIFHKIIMENDTQRLKELYPININGPFKQGVSKLTQEINSKYRDHNFRVKTIEDKDAIQEITIKSPKTMKIYDSSNPSSDKNINFRDVTIPIIFNYPLKSRIMNNWFPFIVFFIGTMITSISNMLDWFYFAAFGVFLSTISLLKIRKNL